MSYKNRPNVMTFTNASLQILSNPKVTSSVKVIRTLSKTISALYYKDRKISNDQLYRGRQAIEQKFFTLLNFGILGLMWMKFCYTSYKTVPLMWQFSTKEDCLTITTFTNFLDGYHFWIYISQLIRHCSLKLHTIFCTRTQKLCAVNELSILMTKAKKKDRTLL